MAIDEAPDSRSPTLTADRALSHALGMSDSARYEIPEEFWSAYSEQPFEVCIDCEQPLTDGGMPYAIQKHFVAGEAVFEMAMCLLCASRLQEEFSQESRRSLLEQIALAPERQRRQDEAARLVEVDSPEGEDRAGRSAEREQQQRIRFEEAMAHCALCGTPRNECHRYSLGTACLGGKLFSAAPELENLGSPFVICEACERRLNESLSQQTRDAWDRFVEETFDGPPALAVDPHELFAMF